MFSMPVTQIGGAIVRRQVRTSNGNWTPGMKLTAEQVLAMRPINRNALVDKKFIELFPKGGEQSSAVGGERFVVSMGFDKFMVIEGKKLTDEPIDREQAYALAGKPEPTAKPTRRKA